METLTRSGAGIIIKPEAVSYPELSDQLEDLVGRYRFVVAKQVFDSGAEAVDLMRRLGPLNEADTRQDGTVMVEEKEGRDVFRSRFALPLHKDGVLTGFDVRLVGIYCVALDGVSGGRTYLTDAMRAVEDVPQEYLAELKENGLEGMAVDATGYYRSEYEGVWHRFPGFYTDQAGRETLALGMPHEEGEPESWRVRVANVGEQRSAEILGALRKAFFDQKYVYFHDWQEGDLLLIDNRETLHGREAWDGRHRQLANIQVLAPA